MEINVLPSRRPGLRPGTFHFKEKKEFFLKQMKADPARNDGSGISIHSLPANHLI